VGWRLLELVDAAASMMTLRVEVRHWLSVTTDCVGGGLGGVDLNGGRCAPVHGGVVEVFAKSLARRVLERSYILSENVGWTSRHDAVSDVEAELPRSGFVQSADLARK
jgi:hypothetical protein